MTEGVARIPPVSMNVLDADLVRLQSGNPGMVFSGLLQLLHQRLAPVVLYGATDG